jgi:predicted acylesterase/phospholipase RssA
MAFRILNFCGGGMRGLMSAIILSRLNERFEKKHGTSLAQKADMIAGTSTGSSITGLLLIGLTPGLIIEFYLLVTRHAFAHAGTSPDAPALPPATFIKTLDKYGVDHKLSSFKKKALFTSFDIGAEDRPWAPMLFHNFPGSPTGDARLLDAMMASGSMPGMTAPYPYVLNGRQLNLVDGAFVHHDPTVPAIALAAAAGNAVSDISAIDIGTGFMRNFITADTSGWGSNQWIAAPGTSNGKLPGLLLNTPPTPQMPFLNLCLNGTSTNLMPDLAGMLLGDRFAYLNPDFGAIYIPENVTSDEGLAFLTLMAETCDLEPALEVLDRYWAD